MSWFKKYKYRYSALDRNGIADDTAPGKRVTGTTEATSVTRALNSNRRKNIYITKIWDYDKPERLKNINMK